MPIYSLHRRLIETDLKTMRGTTKKRREGAYNLPFNKKEEKGRVLLLGKA